MGEARTMLGEMTNAYSILVKIPEGKRQLGRSINKWKDNIKMYFKQLWCESVDWIHLAQDKSRGRLL
jgi:hypothetical protein